MKSIAKCIIFTAIVFLYANAPLKAESSCVTCHTEIDSLSAVQVSLVENSVHKDLTLSCQGCHGGDPSQDDPDLAMSPKNGFIGAPDRSQVVKVCAKCHSDVNFMRNYNPNISVDQYERYQTSQHGILFAKGDHKVATCIDCHGHHDIKKANDPASSVFSRNIADNCGKCHADAAYMSDYGIPTDQVSEYKKSVHANMLYEKGDLSAPTCNDCHGNHSATPPSVTSVGHVCGTCHVIQAEYFASSPHKAAYDEMGIAECEACHGNHGIVKPSKEMLGTTENAVCMECHDEGSAGYNTAAAMRAEIDTLDMQITQAQEGLDKARNAGVETPSDKSLALSSAKDALTQAATAIHTFSMEKVLDFAAKGRKDAKVALDVSAAAMTEVGARRKMLIIMVVLTLVVAGLLLLFIRKREQEPS